MEGELDLLPQWEESMTEKWTENMGLLFCFGFFFEIGSHYIALASMELTV